MNVVFDINSLSERDMTIKMSISNFMSKVVTVIDPQKKIVERVVFITPLEYMVLIKITSDY